MSKELTRESILAMEAGAALDAIVAERVMGWKQDPRPFPRWEDGSEHGSDWYVDGNGDYYECSNQCDTWRPSLDIAAAWVVVEKLSEGWIVVVQRDNGADWLCHIGDIGQYKPHRYGEVTGPAPLAICKAALLTTL
jgi:hypothetical protein